MVIPDILNKTYFSSMKGSNITPYILSYLIHDKIKLVSIAYKI